MKRLLLYLLVLIAAVIPSCVPDTEGEVMVLRVIDGDTIEIAGGAHVRYIGIDTPETYPVIEYYGPEAWAKNRELVEGKLVTLEKDITDKDRYGRLLRYVYADSVFVNAELVRDGYAYASPYGLNLKYEELFSQLEEEARAAGRGLWQN